MVNSCVKLPVEVTVPVAVKLAPEPETESDPPLLVPYALTVMPVSEVFPVKVNCMICPCFASDPERLLFELT